MLNKLTEFSRQYEMIHPGDHIICAVSGGADSVALLFALYLLKDKLEITLEAAHFNHHLRGEESDADAAFVCKLCDQYDIPLHMGEACVTAGAKGLEAAARDARYAFLRTLPGKIATAHTADDNAETVLMHLIRGTGLKGLGGITPVHGNVIRPMLTITRQDVEAFLDEYYVKHIEDSSNGSDDFLRNRIRHHVMPLLREENPRLAQNLTQMALRLRMDEQLLSQMAQDSLELGVSELMQLHPAVRSRTLEQFLKKEGVREPEHTHIAMVEALLYSDKPSARANLPGGVTVSRCYDRLTVLREEVPLPELEIPCPGSITIPGFRVSVEAAQEVINTRDTFTVCTAGKIFLRQRRSGDEMRLSGGTKSLKKIMIDRKIPASERQHIPVIADETGILGVYGIGVNRSRSAENLPAVMIKIEKIGG